MAKVVKQETKKDIVIEAKKATKQNPARIIVKSKGYHKAIPVVYFTEEESDSLLEIVDKVEKDTNANIVYTQ